VSRTTRSLVERRRELSRQKRAAAGTLAKAFPGVEHVVVHLRFMVTTCPAPAAQTHALYPSADAFFEFSCPYGDCDGCIRLDDVALPLLRNGQVCADGRARCSGSRTAGGSARRPCNQPVDYWISAKYRAIARASA
jgi:hypothetical protein